jgi:hypothetical protein
MPAVIFFACLDLEQKSSFMDGHYIYLFVIHHIEKNIRTLNFYECRIEARSRRRGLWPLEVGFQLV